MNEAFKEQLRQIYQQYSLGLIDYGQYTAMTTNAVELWLETQE